MSVLIAAGIAVYENPQVRHWVDSSRRKIAIALHSLGDEIGPRPPSRRSSADPSTRPDDSPEAEERRRRARHEILERGRLLQEKRKLQKKANNARSQSFDDLVDKDGSLIKEKEGASTTATDTKPQTEDQDLRKRSTEAKAAALGSALANPFADEMHTELSLGTEDGVPHPSTTRSSTPTLPISSAYIPTSPGTYPISPESPPVSYEYIRSISPESENIYPVSPLFRPLAVMPDIETISNHSSEALINLTPTTTNSSAAHTGLSEPFVPVPVNQNPWSVHEWAENTSSSFHSPPSEEDPSQAALRAYLELWSPSPSPSPAGTDSDTESLRDVGTDSEIETLSHVGIESDAGSLVEMETNTDTEGEDGRTNGTRTPGTWSEIGSAVSEDF